MSSTISLKEMFENGVHFGHKTSRWHPKMKKYIHAQASGIHIINLEKTADLFLQALEFIHKSVSDGKTILFVATKGQTAEVMKKHAEVCKVPYVLNRWLGGTLTNFKTIKGRIRYFKGLEEKVEKGAFEKYTKKEQANYKLELKKLTDRLGGIRDMERVPDIMFVTDVNRDMIAIKEAKKVGMKVVGFCDTNTNPELVDYPIPTNDDAIKALEYLFGIIVYTILHAKKNIKVRTKEMPKKAVVNKAVLVEKEKAENQEIKKKEVAKKKAA